jgi:hypothetical protein
MSHVAEAHGAGHRESLNRSTVRATAHCLTGCAIGEVLGMVIATALAWGNSASIAISVALAFVFGYALTLGPILGAGVPLRRAAGLTHRTRSPSRRWSWSTTPSSWSFRARWLPGSRTDSFGGALLSARDRVRDHRSREQVAHYSRPRARGRPLPPLTSHLLRLRALSSVGHGLAALKPRRTAGRLGMTSAQACRASSMCVHSPSAREQPGPDHEHV